MQDGGWQAWRSGFGSSALLSPRAQVYQGRGGAAKTVQALASFGWLSAQRAVNANRVLGFASSAPTYLLTTNQ
jgi:hypothetical protein